MAAVGDRFKTGQTCATSGSYVWDGYDDETTAPEPTREECVVPLKAGDTFPSVKSARRAAWWKLHRIVLCLVLGGAALLGCKRAADATAACELGGSDGCARAKMAR